MVRSVFFKGRKIGEGSGVWLFYFYLLDTFFFFRNSVVRWVRRCRELYGVYLGIRRILVLRCEVDVQVVFFFFQENRFFELGGLWFLQFLAFGIDQFLKVGYFFLRFFVVVIQSEEFCFYRFKNRGVIFLGKVDILNQYLNIDGGSAFRLYLFFCYRVFEMKFLVFIDSSGFFYKIM